MLSSGSDSTCPLCDGLSVSFYHRDKKRAYKQCGCCQLVFVEACYRLTAEREKAEYDLHQNSPHDPGYKAFLSRLLVPLLSRLNPGSKGLDFGCGPGPTLSLMLSQAGFETSIFDIYYYDDWGLLHRQYDFITATELVEHLYEPGKVLRHLWSLLPEGGILAVMTKLLIDVQAFSSWHYKNDPTHVCFYSRNCFDYIATMLGADLSIIGNDVILLTKKSNTNL